VDTDLRADVPLRVEGQHADRPAARGRHRLEGLDRHPRLVVVRDDDEAGIDCSDDLASASSIQRQSLNTLFVDACASARLQATPVVLEARPTSVSQM
jgi:hypothetical protein